MRRHTSRFGMAQETRSNLWQRNPFCPQPPLARSVCAHMVGNPLLPYEEGRREVGLEYLNAVQALGLEGMKWLHTMEDEYAAFKINLERMKQQWQKK